LIYPPGHLKNARLGQARRCATSHGLFSCHNLHSNSPFTAAGRRTPSWSRILVSEVSSASFQPPPILLLTNSSGVTSCI
jgi:hypothetical protein